jgi:hypothetical protein
MPLIGNRRALLGGAFSIRSVFANNAPGLWYGTGLTEGYQDSVGTTALTAPGQGTADCPVGYVTDKSGRGLHGLQATAAARPVVSARVNLLIQTEALDNVAWTKTNVTVGTGVADPDGGTTAFTITATAANGTISRAAITQPIGSPSSVYIRRRTGTGTVSMWSGGAYTPVTVTASWARVQVNLTATTTAFLDLKLDTSGDAVDVWHPQVEIGPVGSTATTYQSVTTASTYNTSGFPLMRRHDGIDDGTATAAFAAGTLTSNMDFFCVIRRESAADGTLAQQGAAATNQWFGAWQAGSGTSTRGSETGTPTYVVNGTAVPGGTGTTRAQLHTAMPVGSILIVEAHNLDLSTWTAFNTGNYGAGFNLNGSLGDVVLCPAQTDAVRAKIRRDLARRFGISL